MYASSGYNSRRLIFLIKQLDWMCIFFGELFSFLCFIYNYSMILNDCSRRPITLWNSCSITYSFKVTSRFVTFVLCDLMTNSWAQGPGPIDIKVSMQRYLQLNIQNISTAIVLKNFAISFSSFYRGICSETGAQ